MYNFRLIILLMPEWRNWQTHATQTRVSLRTCGFKSHLRHKKSGQHLAFLFPGIIIHNAAKNHTLQLPLESLSRFAKIVASERKMSHYLVVDRQMLKASGCHVREGHSKWPGQGGKRRASLLQQASNPKIAAWLPACGGENTRHDLM